MDELSELAVETVVLGGGEATLHPQLPELLQAAQQRGLPTGLTTKRADPNQVIAIADAGLVDRFDVSAGKGEGEPLVSHRRAITNQLLLRGEMSQIVEWRGTAIKLGHNAYSSSPARGSA